MIAEKFIILAVLITLIGNSNYIINVFRGQTKPNRVTWFMWTLMPAITLLAMLDKDTGVTPIVLTFMSVLACGTIFIASLVNKKAFWKITTFDYICGGLSFFGVLGWIIIGEGNIAILFAIIADLLASLPTFIKAYKFPATESWLNYLGGAVGAIITLLTIEVWSFAAIAWALDVLFVCTAMLLLVKFKIGPRFSSLITRS